MKIWDFSELTFVIPVTSDRQNNLEVVLKYLNSFLKTNILIGVQIINQQNCLSIDFKQFENLKILVEYFDFKTDRFFKTRLINQLVLRTKTKYFVMQDADIILEQYQYKQAINYIEISDVVLPYNFPTIDIIKERVENFKTDLIIKQDFLKRQYKSNKFCNGGIVFFLKQAFLNSGGYNENMVSWGPEDDESILRMGKFGLKVVRLQGYIFHLWHERNSNSDTTNKFFQNNQDIYESVKNMDIHRLNEYIEKNLKKFLTF